MVEPEDRIESCNAAGTHVTRVVFRVDGVVQRFDISCSCQAVTDGARSNLGERLVLRQDRI